MFKKNKKQTETIKEPKEKKVRTVKVGTHKKTVIALWVVLIASCLLYTSPSPRDRTRSRMPSSA